MPYSVELNDIPIMMIQQHRAEELFDRTVAQFDRLYAEAESQGAKVMGLACTPISAACRTESAGSRRRWRTWLRDPARCSGKDDKSWIGI